jgi:PAS domain S-box-containing protein
MSENHHQQLFQDAFHFAAIGMALVGLDGRWLRVNRSVSELLGYTEAELLAGSFQDITHPDDLALDLAYVDDLVQGRITHYQMDKRYFRKDGEIVWVCLDVSLVRDAEGKPQHFISQLMDISARKKAELELTASSRENQRLLEELRERSRQIEEVQRQIVRVCAWTKQVFFDDQWISLEDFLGTYLHLRLTHGMSDTAFRELSLPETKDGETDL